MGTREARDVLFRRRLKEAHEAGRLALAADPLRIWGLAQVEEPEPAWMPAIDTAVYKMMEAEDLDDETAVTLSLGYLLISGRSVEEVPAATFLATRAVAAVGYMSREAECDRFAHARELDDDGSAPLRAALASASALGPTGAAGADLAVAAAWLARHEAIDPRPTDDFRPSWTVPGIRGDERRHLRERTLAIVVRPGPSGALATPQGEVHDATLDDFRRTWKYGFFLRCLVELVLRDSRRTDPD